MIRADFLHENGLDPAKQSYLFNILNVKGNHFINKINSLGGGGDKFFEVNELYRCKTGNQSLVNSMLENLRKNYEKEGNNNDVIHLNDPVILIDTIDKNKVRVKTESGKVYEGDYVVCAVPSAELNKIHFNPKLQVMVKGKLVDFQPKQAIQNGYLYKYIMKTPNRFWLSDAKGMSALTDKYGEFWDGISSNSIIHQ